MLISISRFHFKWLSTSCITLIFIFQSTLNAAPSVGFTSSQSTEIQSQILDRQILKQNLSDFISPEIATLDHAWSREREGEFPQKKVVFHIRDAHGNYDAQINVQRIIEKLVQHFGVRLLLLEGGVSKLDPSGLNSITDPKIKHAVIDDLLRRAELTGAETFLIESDQAAKVSAHGIEEIKAYGANLKDFQSVLARQAAGGQAIRKLRQDIETISSRMLNKKLRQFLKSWREWKEDRMDLNQFLDLLKAQAFKTLSLKLPDPALQKRYPTLVRFFKLKETEPLIGFDDVEKERHQLLEWLYQQKVNGSVFADLETWHVQDLLHGWKGGSLRTMLENLWQQTSSIGFSFERYPALTKVWRYLILSSELDGVRLMNEMSDVNTEIFNTLSENDTERELIEVVHHSILLEKIFNLELSRGEVLYVRNHRSKLTPSHIARITSSWGHGLKMSFRGSQKLDQLLEDVLHFYDRAEEREKHLVQNALKLLLNQKNGPAVLVSGGYHTEALRGMFTKRGYTFIEISPTIREIEPGREAYLNRMKSTSIGRGSAKTSYITPALRLDAAMQQSNEVQAVPFWLESALRTSDGDLEAISHYQFDGFEFRVVERPDGNRTLIFVRLGQSHAEAIIQIPIRKVNGTWRAVIEKIDRLRSATMPRTPSNLSGLIRRIDASTNSKLATERAEPPANDVKSVPFSEWIAQNSPSQAEPKTTVLSRSELREKTALGTLRKSAADFLKRFGVARLTLGVSAFAGALRLPFVMVERKTPRNRSEIRHQEILNRVADTLKVPEADRLVIVKPDELAHFAGTTKYVFAFFDGDREHFVRTRDLVHQLSLGTKLVIVGERADQVAERARHIINTEAPSRIWELRPSDKPFRFDDAFKAVNVRPMSIREGNWFIFRRSKTLHYTILFKWGRQVPQRQASRVWIDETGRLIKETLPVLYEFRDGFAPAQQEVFERLKDGDTQLLNILIAREAAFISKLNPDGNLRGLPTLIQRGVLTDQETGRQHIVMRFEKPLVGKRIKLSDYLLQASQVVDFAHLKGIVHNDLYFTNLYVNENGNVVVLDWMQSFSMDEASRLEASQDGAVIKTIKDAAIALKLHHFYKSFTDIPLAPIRDYYGMALTILQISDDSVASTVEINQGLLNLLRKYAFGIIQGKIIPTDPNRPMQDWIQIIQEFKSQIESTRSELRQVQPVPPVAEFPGDPARKENVQLPKKAARLQPRPTTDVTSDKSSFGPDAVVDLSSAADRSELRQRVTSNAIGPDFLVAAETAMEFLRQNVQDQMDVIEHASLDSRLIRQRRNNSDHSAHSAERWSGDTEVLDEGYEPSSSVVVDRDTQNRELIQFAEVYLESLKTIINDLNKVSDNITELIRSRNAALALRTHQSNAVDETRIVQLYGRYAALFNGVDDLIERFAPAITDALKQNHVIQPALTLTEIQFVLIVTDFYLAVLQDASRWTLPLSNKHILYAREFLRAADLRLRRLLKRLIRNPDEYIMDHQVFPVSQLRDRLYDLIAVQPERQSSFGRSEAEKWQLEILRVTVRKAQESFRAQILTNIDDLKPGDVLTNRGGEAFVYLYRSTSREGDLIFGLFDVANGEMVKMPKKKLGLGTPSAMKKLVAKASDDALEVLIPPSPRILNELKGYIEAIDNASDDAHISLRGLNERVLKLENTRIKKESRADAVVAYLQEWQTQISGLHLPEHREWQTFRGELLAVRRSQIDHKKARHDLKRQEFVRKLLVSLYLVEPTAFDGEVVRTVRRILLGLPRIETDEGSRAELRIARDVVDGVFRIGSPELNIVRDSDQVTQTPNQSQLGLVRRAVNRISAGESIFALPHSTSHVAIPAQSKLFELNSVWDTLIQNPNQFHVLGAGNALIDELKSRVHSLLEGLDQNTKAIKAGRISALLKSLRNGSTQTESALQRKANGRLTVVSDDLTLLSNLSGESLLGLTDLENVTSDEREAVLPLILNVFSNLSVVHAGTGAALREEAVRLIQSKASQYGFEMNRSSGVIEVRVRKLLDIVVAEQRAFEQQMRAA